MQYDKILGYIEEGKKEGATLHLGGNALKDSKDGYFIEVNDRITYYSVTRADAVHVLANYLH